MKNTKKSLVIIGPYPPPYGGVSVHIQRIARLLQIHNIPYVVFDQYYTEDRLNNVYPTMKKISWWFCFLFCKSPKLVHFHQFSFFIFIYAFIYSRFHSTKIYISIHNEDLLNHSILKRWFSIFLMRFTANVSIIVVSQKLFSHLNEYDKISIHYIPAYVPPVVTSPKSLADKINSYKMVFFFNAWRLNEQESNVYGFDLLLKLALEYNDIIFFCFVGDIKSGDFVTKKSAYFNVTNIKSIVGENLVDYMHEADLFLRLNREDAYGVSIKESLDLGVPVIASNVCLRPSGTVLFETGSFESLNEQIKKFIDHGFKTNDDMVDKSVYHVRLLELYANDLGVSLINIR